MIILRFGQWADKGAGIAPPFQESGLHKLLREVLLEWVNANRVECQAGSSSGDDRVIEPLLLNTDGT